MKVKLKKSVDIPQEIKAFTDRVLATPLERIAEALAGFVWKYEKGDFYHWVPLFNRFDEFFDENVRSRPDLSLNSAGGGEAIPPFPTANTLALLKVTARILENCTNKHLYQSYEHLTALLAAPDKEVVVGALAALVAFLRKTHHSSVRFHGHPQLNARLFDLCRGWGGKEEGLDLVACANRDESHIEKFVSKGTTLHFDFYVETAPDVAAEDGESRGAGGLQVIHIPGLHKIGETEHELLRRLVEKHDVPQELRFRLLTRIRIAQAFGTLEGRRHLVRVRLMAFCVLFQSNPLHEPEFMNELVGLVQAEEGVPLELRTYAVRALAVQLVDRSRHSAVINAIGVGGQNGVLSILMQDSIDDITSSSSDAKPKYNAHFVEALLSLVGALVSSSSGSVALSEAGLIPTLLPLIQNTNPAHVSLVCTAVKILEAFMDFSSSASAMFRGLGGLTYMIKRLEFEVGLEGGDPSTVGPSASSQGSDPFLQETKRQKPSGADGTVKQIPYACRLLLKSLLRAITLASYAPSSGTGTRPNDADSLLLYKCLETMFLRAREFGGALFALAASVVTDLIHHDPLCFRSLHEAGVPDAFLKAVKAGVIPSSEAVYCVPNTLVALCLNNVGLGRVRDTHALDCLVTVFTSRYYLRALSGDTANILGAGVDELLRHVPSLKEEVIDVVVAIFRALCILGGDSELLAQEEAAVREAEAKEQEAMDTDSRPSMESGEVAAGDVDMGTSEEPCDSTAVGASRGQGSLGGASISSSPVRRRVPIPSEVLERGKEQNSDLCLPEYISHAAKMLESLLSNQDSSRRLVENGGVDLLLRLYRLPRMPPAFGSSSQSHPLMSIFRPLAPNHSQVLPKKVKQALAAQLDDALKAAEAMNGACIPTLPAKERDEYVRFISSTSGLAALAATVARTATPMLTEVCTSESPVMSGLGRLERIVLWQLSMADFWKEQRDKERAEEAAAGEGDDVSARPLGSLGNASDTGVIEEVPDSADVRMAVGEDGDGAGDPDAEQMDVETESLSRDTPAESRIAAGLAEATTSLSTTRSKKKSPEDLACDVLQHFVGTVRGFYTAVAKSIHTPARRREEPLVQPTMPMRAAALGLALVLTNNLDYEVPGIGYPSQPGTSSSSSVTLSLACQAKHLTRLVEEVLMVLFDTRRRCCHTLILNYFVSCGGIKSLIAKYRTAVEMLWAEVEQKRQESDETAAGLGSGSDAVAAPTAQVGSLGGPADLGVVDSARRLLNKAKQVFAEGIVLSFLSLFEQLTNVNLLLASSQAASLLTVPLPSPETSDAPLPPPTEVEAFIKNLQATMLGAVLPLWSDPRLDQASPLIANSVISILNSCVGGTANISGVLQRTRYGIAGRATQAPDPALVQQIVDMGFARARAEEAVRRVGHNSVDLAVEWLFGHPEEQGSEGQQTEDQALADALTASLNEIGGGLGSAVEGAEQGGADLQVAKTPDPEELVNGAISILERMPVAAFVLAELLMTLCNRDGGKDRGMVISHLVERLRGQGPMEINVKRSVPSLNAPAHLLAVLLSESSPCREAAVQHGVVQVVLEMLEAWEVNYSAAMSAAQLQTTAEVVGDGECSRGDKKMPEIPMWVEGLLLVLEAISQQQPKQPAASGATTTGAAAAVGTVTSSSAPTDLSTPATAVPPRAAPAAPPQTSAATATPSPSMMGGLVQVLSTWQPCGLLSEADQQKALQLSLRMLPHLHAYGKNWKAPATAEGDLIATPEPASITQAVMQLLSRLTRNRKCAQEVLHQDGVVQLLELPAACLLLHHEVHLTTILKHILEDSGTLQAYMEAEIKNLLTSRNRSNASNLGPFSSGNSSSMPVRSFLQNLSHVVNRDPAVFMEAVAASCSLDESVGIHSRQAISLRKTRSEGRVCGTSGTQSTSQPEPASEGPTPLVTKGRAGKRVVPVTFVEVIDKLLDVVLKFDPSVAMEKANKEVTEKEKVEVASTGGTSGGARGGAPSTALADAASRLRSAVADLDSRDPFHQLSQLLRDMPGGSNGQAGSAAAAAASQVLEAGTSVSSHTRDVVMNNSALIRQMMVLRMLTEFCLMYASTVGVLLKRDTEKCSDGGADSTSKGPGVGGLLHCLMHTQLSCPADASPLRPSIAEETSRFLQAVCIRSAEGRRRIISEVVKTINSAAVSGKAKSATVNMPFVSNKTPGHKVKNFVDLVGGLLSASTPSQSSGRSPPSSGLSVEMIRTMRDAGVVSALTKALKLIDLDHPQAPRAINSIIKPLEVLTRNLPALTRKSLATTGTNAQQAARQDPAMEAEANRVTPPAQAVADVAMGDMQTQAVVTDGAGPASSSGLGGAAEHLSSDPHAMDGLEHSEGHHHDEDHQVPEAGPQAWAEAERMMEEAQFEGDEVLAHEEDEDDTDDDHEMEDVQDTLSEDDDNGLSGEDVDDHEQDDDEEVDDEDEEEDADEHVVVEENEDSDGIGHDDASEDSHSHSILDEDEEDIDEEDDEASDDGLDMDAAEDEADEWGDDDVSRELEEDADGLERLEGEVWIPDDEMDGFQQIREEALNLGQAENTFFHLQPRLTQLRSMVGNLMGTLVGSGNTHTGRTRFRYRFQPPREQREGGTNVPYLPTMGALQHRLLVRPPAPPQTGSTSRSVGTLTTEALLGGAPGGSMSEGFSWRRVNFTSDLLTGLSEGELGNSPIMTFRFDDQLRPLTRMGGGTTMGGTGQGSMLGIDLYGQGRDSNRGAAAANTPSWLTGVQGTIEQHMVNMLREAAPQTQQTAAGQQQQQSGQTSAAADEPAERTAEDPTTPVCTQETNAEQPEGMDAQRNPDEDMGLPESPAGVVEQGVQTQPLAQSQGEADAEENLAAGTSDFASGERPPSPDRAASDEDPGSPKGSQRSGSVLTAEFLSNAIQNTLRALASSNDQEGAPLEPGPSGQPATAQGGPSTAAEGGDRQGLGSSSAVAVPGLEDEVMAEADEGNGERGDDGNEPGTLQEGGEVEAGAGGEEGQASARVEGEAGTDAAQGTDAALDAEILERARAAGIDPAFLEALPRSLQIEVLSQHGVSVDNLLNPSTAGQGENERQQPDEGTDGAPGEPASAATAGGNDGERTDRVDPEFLAALPPDIREEVLESQRLAERRREIERRLTQGGPDDVANFVATLPEDIREEVLLYSGPDVLANLPPNLIAEGQQLRDRNLWRHDPMSQMGRTFIFGQRRRQDGDGGEGRNVVGRLGTGRKSPGASGQRREEMEGPPPMDLDALVMLVELLRLSQPIHKGQLQKLFLNLCSQKDTRKSILQLLLCRLKESSGGRDDEGAEWGESGSLAGHVQHEGSSGQQWPGTTATVTRRVLDLLSYLARHQSSKVAESLLELHVPASPQGLKAADLQMKGKLPADSTDQVVRALDILLEMLGRPLCQRSIATLEQNLQLLEVVMQSAATKVTAAALLAQQAAEEAAAASKEKAAAEENARDAGQGTEGENPASTKAGPSAGDAIREPAADAGQPSAPSTSQSADELAHLSEFSYSLLKWLPSLLGCKGLSERAYRTCATVIKLLVEAAPCHRAFMLTELSKEVVRLAEATVKNLQNLEAKGIEGSSTTFTSIGSTGALILRILQAYDSLLKVGMPSGTDQQPESDSVTLLRQIVGQLEPLWHVLSTVINQIEDNIRGNSNSRWESTAAAKVLPPGAAQILPLVESFFVLCSSQGALRPPAASAGSAELGCSSPGALVPSSVDFGTPASGLETRLSVASGSSIPETSRSQPLQQFAERHRVMLNAFLRQNSGLLETSFAPLLRTPRLVDFDNKRLYFRSKVRSEERHYGSLRINVRREHVFEDSFHQLRHKTPEELRCKLSVQFTGEEGIDAGGVSREWYQVMSREIFNPNLALFVAVPEQTSTFQPNPNSIVQNDRGVNHLDFFKFVGRMIGKALYDGQLVDAHFTRSFYKHMLNQGLTYEDLEAVDPENFKNLKWMLEHNNAELLSLNFDAEMDYFGRKEVVELKPGGSKIRVTEENKKEYVNLVTKHKMTTAIREQIKAFQQGFWELVPKDLVVIFNDHELELLISGLPDIDIADLRANTEYSGYTAASPVIQWFWEVVEVLSKEEQALLLQFVTGTSKVPLEGFTALQGISGPQKFQIHKSYVEPNRLPSAHTCFNQLDLPEYPSLEQLKDRLLVAIHEGREGFSFG